MTAADPVFPLAKGGPRAIRTNSLVWELVVWRRDWQQPNSQKRQGFEQQCISSARSTRAFDADWLACRAWMPTSGGRDNSVSQKPKMRRVKTQERDEVGPAITWHSR